MTSSIKRITTYCSHSVLALGIALSLTACRDGVDYIVAGDYVLTMDDQGNVIEDGAIVIDDGKILAVGPAKEIYRDYQSTHVIAGNGRVLMPGFINGHTHSAMTLFRGIADDRELMDWLENFIFPLEAEFVTPEFVEVGATLACYEMIRGGTTTFVDMYFYPEVIAKVTENCGLRAIITAPMIDYPSPGFDGWDDSHAAGVEFVEQWQNKNSRITPGLAPHAPYTVAAQHLQEVGESARRLHAPVSIHLAETYTEFKTIQEQENTTPIQFALNQIGENWVIGAHGVYAQPEDLPSMAKPNFGVIHNPTSNAKLASGIAPVTTMLKAGVAVGLGTDGAASNNDLNMLEEIKLAALLHKLRESAPTAMPAKTAVSLATDSGAKAIGMANEIGSLTAGMEADVIQIQLDDLRSLPIYDVYSQLVYTLDGRDVVTNIVDGKLLMDQGKVLTINTTKLRADAQRVTADIKEKFSASHNSTSSQQ